MKQKKQTFVDVSTGEILPKIKTQLTSRMYPKDYETNLLSSLTVPGQSMTVADIVARYRKGLPIDQTAKIPLYQGEELMPDIDKMDLVDRAEYMDSVADYLVDLKEKIAATARTKREKDILDQVDQGIREHLAKHYPKKSDITDITPE